MLLIKKPHGAALPPVRHRDPYLAHSLMGCAPLVRQEVFAYFVQTMKSGFMQSAHVM